MPTPPQGWVAKNFPTVNKTAGTVIHGGLGRVNKSLHDWTARQAERLGFEVCFAAGTPIRHPFGSKPVENFASGDLILSRDDNNPAGLVVAKTVEEVFVREGLVWHLHVGGQVIRTTAEHPFYAHGKGWVACHELTIGDWLLTEDGRWAAVEDLLDTGEWETVYNLRVADYHTYFVGCQEWGFSVWAHNARCAVVETDTGFNLVDLKTGQVVYRNGRSFVEVADFAGEAGHTLSAAPKRLPLPANSGIPDNVPVLARQQVTFNDSSWLAAGKSIKAAHSTDAGVVYGLRDARTGEVLKVGVDNPAKLPEVWRRYKNAQDGLPHRELVMDVTVVDTRGLGSLKGLEKTVHGEFIDRGHRLRWDNDYPRGRLGRGGPGVPFVYDSRWSHRGYDWVQQQPGVDPVYIQVTGPRQGCRTMNP